MENVPQHIAIIMDGNRRWAKKHFLPSPLGHANGVDTLERLIYDCIDLGVKYLTVYAFSTENWKRSAKEVEALMKLLAINVRDVDKKIKNKEIRYRLVGDITGLSESLQKGIREVEEKTKDRPGLSFNIAINYGGRAEMTLAAKQIAKEVQEGKLNVEDINEEVVNRHLQTLDLPDPDLIIRTGGEQRLSGFLLWQSAYSELYFTDVLWPDFNREELIKAIEEFNNRKRNFGK